MIALISNAGRTISLAGVVVAIGCAPVDAPDQNNQALGDLTGAPSVSSITTATQGLIIGMRGDANTITQRFSILGREAYNLDPGNPANEQDYYDNLGDLAAWANPYATIKLADLVMASLDKVTGLSAAQADGIRGFAKTVKAIELLNVIRCTDVGGALLDAAANVTDSAGAIATKADVYTQIFTLLDQAKVHLQAAGGSFAFSLSPGFAGFETPAAFLTLNRAVRARADVDMQNWSVALTDLQGSFLDTTQPASLGMYFTYSTVSGDAINPLFEGQPRVYFTHPRILNNAQKKPDGTLDNRVLAKVKSIAPLSRFGYAVSATWTIYTSQTASVAYIRNEELVLLRAEANLGLGNMAAAVNDINFIRVNSGGLGPIALPYVPAPGAPPTLLDELLYNKTYSMMWEMGSSSWLDARHYGKLAALPHDLPGDVVYPYLRIADSECDPRNPKPLGCITPTGL
jgi:hypothetical protein